MVSVAIFLKSSSLYVDWGQQYLDAQLIKSTDNNMSALHHLGTGPQHSCLQLNVYMSNILLLNVKGVSSLRMGANAFYKGRS